MPVVRRVVRRVLDLGQHQRRAQLATPPRDRPVQEPAPDPASPPARGDGEGVEQQHAGARRPGRDRAGRDAAVALDAVGRLEARAPPRAQVVQGHQLGGRERRGEHVVPQRGELGVGRERHDVGVDGHALMVSPAAASGSPAGTRDGPGRAPGDRARAVLA
ncbi:hypothetical protein ACQFYA_13775 [Promicromonospora sp. Marseille-Q5078]